MDFIDIERYEKFIIENIKKGVMFDPSFFAFKESKDILLNSIKNLIEGKYTKERLI